MIMKSNFFFYTNLVQPKAVFKLNNFFLLKKKKPHLFLTSFRKSYARFSHNLSSNFWIRISTLKKIKNKILLKNFIFYLFSSESWFSFSTTDVIDQTNRNFFQIWKILKTITISKFENLDFQIYSTNKVFNKIFKNFVSLFIVGNNQNSNIFLEKYFYKEKYTRALNLTNNLKFFLIKFFLFFLPSSTNMKKLNFLNKQKTLNFFLKKLNNFMQMFTNKRYFIFFSTKLKLSEFKEIFIQFTTSLNLLDALVFFQGNIFYKSDQNSIFINNLNILSKNLDINFINFFIKINKKNFLAFVLSSPFSQIQLNNSKNLMPLILNELFLNLINTKFWLIRFINNIIKLRLIMLFFLFCFFKKIIFYKCQRLNN